MSESGIILDLLANPSVTGYTTLDLTDQELPLLRGVSPDIITLQIGVNDFFQGVSLEEFTTRYTRLLEDILRISPHSRLILIDIPDYGKTPYGRQTGDPRVIHDGITLYNARIRTIAEKYHLPVADVFTPSLLVEMDTSLTTSD